MVKLNKGIKVRELFENAVFNLTTQFSLDRKRWRQKQNQYSAADRPSVVQFWFDPLIVTPTQHPVASENRSHLVCFNTVWKYQNGRYELLIYPVNFTRWTRRLEYNTLLYEDRIVLALGQIVGGAWKHATCDVYSPKTVDTLIHAKCYAYCFLYFVYNIFSCDVIEELDSKGILNTLKKGIKSPWNALM